MTPFGPAKKCERNRTQLITVREYVVESALNGVEKNSQTLGTFWKWMDGLEKLDFFKEGCTQIYQYASLAFFSIQTACDGCFFFCVETAAALEWMASPWFLDLTRSQVKKIFKKWARWDVKSDILLKHACTESFVFSKKPCKVLEFDVLRSVLNNCTDYIKYLWNNRETLATEQNHINTSAILMPIFIKNRHETVILAVFFTFFRVCLEKK